MKRRKDGRFQKVITINGKKHFFYSTAATSRAAEKDIANQLLAYKEAGEKGKLFTEVAEEWENKHLPKLEYNTSRRYKSLLKHATSHFKGTYIKKVKPSDIERYLGDFAAKNYTTKSIKDILSVVRLVFKYAYINEYVTSDPTQYIQPPKGKKSVQREALTDKEIDVVKKSINCTCGLLPYFLLYTGLRKGEALALQYKDINRKRKEISVTKSIYHDGNKPYIKDTKTASGNRTVILLDNVAKVLPKGNKNGYIFSKTGKEPMSNSWFQCQWAAYCKETGLNITAHQLRHTYATILFEANIDVKDAQNLMGHSDITTTRNIYTHIRENRLQSTAQQLNTFVSQELVKNSEKHKNTT